MICYPEIGSLAKVRTDLFWWKLDERTNIKTTIPKIKQGLVDIRNVSLVRQIVSLVRQISEFHGKKNILGLVLDKDFPSLGLYDKHGGHVLCLIGNQYWIIGYNSILEIVG